MTNKNTNPLAEYLNSLVTEYKPFFIKHRKPLAAAAGAIIILSSMQYVSGYNKGLESISCEKVTPMTRVLFSMLLDQAAEQSVHNFLYTNGMKNGMQSKLNSCGR